MFQPQWRTILICIIVNIWLTPEIIFTEILRSPINLDVYVSGITTTLFWSLNGVDLNSVKCFRVTYEVVGSPGRYFSITYDIDGSRRACNLRGLAPLSTYRLFMVTIGANGRTSNTSDVIEFTTALPGWYTKYDDIFCNFYDYKCFFVFEKFTYNIYGLLHNDDL